MGITGSQKDVAELKASISELLDALEALVRTHEPFLARLQAGMPPVAAELSTQAQSVQRLRIIVKATRFALMDVSQRVQ